MLRFSCEKALLQSAVNTVSRAVAAKSSIPALEGILVEGSDRLTMSGYNMQTGIRTAFEAEVHEEGRIVLNARLFGEIIRKLPDDLVVVRQQQTANNGEIVVALLGDEATVKRYSRRNGQVWLLPENEAYSPIDGHDAQILGKVAAVIRRY
mgnify:CR=1 FL=1